ncbi:MAG: hypothetical protein MUF59_06520 [Candidatus Krumholzibacteria bacterium]|nr:hypothetical protein [Candidatus Krumholzibacteria bacterium]
MTTDNVQYIGFVLFCLLVFFIGGVIGSEIGQNTITDKLESHGYTLYDSGRMLVEVYGDRYYSIGGNVSERSLPKCECWRDDNMGGMWIDISGCSNHTSPIFIKEGV